MRNGMTIHLVPFFGTPVSVPSLISRLMSRVSRLRLQDLGPVGLTQLLHACARRARESCGGGGAESRVFFLGNSLWVGVCVGVHLFVCLFVCWFVCLFVCLFVRSFVCLCVCLLVCLCVCLLACLFACLLACLLACLFVCLFACLLACLCVCLFGVLLACVHACVRACLLVCLLACFLVCLRVSENEPFGRLQLLFGVTPKLVFKLSLTLQVAVFLMAFCSLTFASYSLRNPMASEQKRCVGVFVCASFCLWFCLPLKPKMLNCIFPVAGWEEASPYVCC